ncbi:AMP-binding protein [Rubrivivax albus]|uniref:AMP-binding acetyl-CoA synthetase n=1 Tax=Rubrivivax albus TaxID=2499835 RepID=A0A437JNP9_9BURK|nr:AMP-binding protein [Rubrivivax albus]RVT48455.1 AMP-binding acetyl-CoA synthetase [Rubrivivax albus]
MANDTSTPLLLDLVYDHEAAHPDRIYLTQPLTGGSTVDFTWGQTLDQARRMATHLQAQGFAPGARIAILSKNCAHFIIAELAIWLAGYTTVAIFPTEKAATVRFVLEHSEASLLFVGKLDTWDEQRGGVPASLPMIALPLAPASAADLPRWDDVIAKASPMPGRPARAADDLAMILYTSGSTGTPKGVMTSFGAITRTAQGIAADTRRRVGPGESRMLSYLPLAHSFERSWVEAASLADGATHIYFAESLDTFLQDLQRARPTLFISVPRLWLKFQQGVFAKMPPAKLDRLLGIPILGGIVRKKVLKGLGLDAVKQAGSGSAPLPADLIRWYRRLGLQLFEGYGMSEDNSYSHSSNEDHGEPGWVGVPMPGVECRIAEDGEVLIRSPGQFSGYYKDPALTAESFTADGFFRTGDLGERRPDGMLKITGRKKELFKTAKGKYVAPAPIENLINVHPMVEMSMVTGNGQVSAIAVVVLSEALQPRLGDDAVRTEVESEMKALLAQVNGQLSDYEKLHTIVIAREAWSIDNGLLTPTMKLKRARIEQAIAGALPAWYERKGVLWH